MIYCPWLCWCHHRTRPASMRAFDCKRCSSNANASFSIRFWVDALGCRSWWSNLHWCHSKCQTQCQLSLWLSRTSPSTTSRCHSNPCDRRLWISFGIWWAGFDRLRDKCSTSSALCSLLCTCWTSCSRSHCDNLRMISHRNIDTSIKEKTIRLRLVWNGEIKDDYVYLNPVNWAIELTFQIANTISTRIIGSQIIGHVFSKRNRHCFRVNQSENASSKLNKPETYQARNKLKYFAI